MKKVIAAAAGLMLAGAMVGTASAAVTFGGDARVRTYFESDYDLGATVPVTDPVTGNAIEGQFRRANEEVNDWSSRVRIKVNADSAGGAYARARIRMADATWDGTRQTRNRGAGTNSYVDYAYIGVPIGPVTVEGGLMTQNLTKWFLWDRRGDQLVVKYANDMTELQVWYEKNAEFTDPNTDFIDDNDIDVWYAALTQKFAGDFGLTVIGAYVDDQRPIDNDISGFTGTAHIGGPAGPVALEAEVSYREGDIDQQEDDGYGGYIQGAMDFGAASLAVQAGWTQDGFAADNDFGFIMIGGASSITPSFFDSGGTGIGNGGDTAYIGATVGYQVSEPLSLKGNLVYADVDEVGNFFEISGSLGYVISDGATFTWDIGYLNFNNDVDNAPEESPFGTALTLEISY